MAILLHLCSGDTIRLEIQIVNGDNEMSSVPNYNTISLNYVFTSQLYIFIFIDNGTYLSRDFNKINWPDKFLKDKIIIFRKLPYSTYLL